MRIVDTTQTQTKVVDSIISVLDTGFEHKYSIKEDCFTDETGTLFYHVVYSKFLFFTKIHATVYIDECAVRIYTKKKFFEDNYDAFDYLNEYMIHCKPGVELSVVLA